VRQSSPPPDRRWS